MSKQPKRKRQDGAAQGAGRGKRARAFVWLARGLVASFFLASAGLLSAVALFSYYSRDLPGVKALKHYDPPQISRFPPNVTR